MGNVSFGLHEMIRGYSDGDSTDEDADSTIGQEYLAMFLQRMISIPNHIELYNPVEEHRRHILSPTIKKKPNLTRLKKSVLYKSIQKASGYGIDKEIIQKWTVMDMLANREKGIGQKNGSFTQTDKCKINNQYLPNKMKRNLVRLRTKFYCGIFSKDGQKFLSAGQNNYINVLDSSNNKYKPINRITTKNVNWSILDMAISPDGEHFCYTSWSDTINIAKINGTFDDIQTIMLHGNGCITRCAIFSVSYSNCGRQLLGASKYDTVFVCDYTTKQFIHRLEAVFGGQDINAVSFTDETSNIFVTGCDGGILKYWDQRCLQENNRHPVGIHVGHMDGITYIDSRNDGRHLISNSKDQSIKLWDMRKFSSPDCEMSARHFKEKNHFDWDYRTDNVPSYFYNPRCFLKGDTSLMTYRGHTVVATLIRAKFSPLATTAQRYIYTGCGTGRIIIYDVLTGNIVRVLKSHKDTVRDVDWHPQRAEIISSSWDDNVILNEFDNNHSKEEERESIRATSWHRQSPLPLRRSQRLALRRSEREQA